MATEELINGLKRLRKDARNKTMDPITARQKIKQAIDFADSLSLKIKDLRIRSTTDFYINVQKEAVDKRNNDNYDLLFLCANVLMMWDCYIKMQNIYK